MELPDWMGWCPTCNMAPRGPDGRVKRKAISRRTRKLVYNRDKHRCRECGSRRNLTLDHVIPLARGGSNKASNLQVLCRRCNNAKGDSVGDNY